MRRAALLAATLALPPSFASAGPKEDVESRVRTTVERVLAVLRDASLGKAEKRRIIYAEVEPLVDFALMGKLALGRRHWERMSPAQRSEFSSLFIEQLKASYYEKIDLYAGETVEFDAAAARGGKYELGTRLLGRERPVEIVYKLYRTDGGWRVYDLVIEGVSLVRSHGSQYHEFLRERGVEELLSRMRDDPRGLAPPQDGPP